MYLRHLDIINFRNRAVIRTLYLLYVAFLHSWINSKQCNIITFLNWTIHHFKFHDISIKICNTAPSNIIMPWTCLLQTFNGLENGLRWIFSRVLGLSREIYSLLGASRTYAHELLASIKFYFKAYKCEHFLVNNDDAICRAYGNGVAYVYEVRRCATRVR